MKRKSIYQVIQIFLFGTIILMQQVCFAESKKLEKIGLQLYSVRQAMQKDFKGTIIQVAKAGYDQVEFAGYYDHSPKEIRALLDSLGLTAPAAHLGYNLLSGENLAKTIEDARTIGHEYLIMPSLPPIRPPEPGPAEGEPRRRGPRPFTLDEVKKIAGIFNEVGKACQDAGLKFAYHNHQFEFMQIDSSGPVMFDILLQETDPTLVDFELDIGWAVVAGADPVAYFKKYPGRFRLFHVKDMDAEKHSVVVGKGTIDFASLFAQSELAGAKYYIVEYEGHEDPITSVAESVSFLKELTY